MELSWDDLRIFAEAARHGSLTRCARALGIGQATASRRIAALESQLGHRLFDRTADGLRLTAAGERALARAEAMESLAHELGASLRELERRPEGVVRVAVTPGLASELVGPYMRLLRPRYPDLRLEVVASTNNTDLTRGEADLAVRLRPPTSGDLVVRKLGTIAMGLYASSRFVERLPAGIRLRDLEVVGFAADVGRVPMSKWLEEHVARPPVLTSNHLPTLRRAAQLGLGAAVLGELEATLHDLVPVPIEHPPLPEVPWYLVTHAALRAVPRVRAVADFLLDLVRRPPAELRALQDPEPTRGSGRGRTRSSRG